MGGGRRKLGKGGGKGGREWRERGELGRGRKGEGRKGRGDHCIKSLKHYKSHLHIHKRAAQQFWFHYPNRV